MSNVIPLFPQSTSGSVELPDFNFRDLWVLIVRYWRAMGMALAVGLVMASLVVMLVPATYEGEAVVIVEARKAKINEGDNVVSGVSPDTTSVLSEIEIIRSRNIAEQIVQDFGLYYHSFFNPESQLKEWPIKTPKVVDQTDDGVTAFQKRQAVDIFIENLTIEPKGRSLAIEMTMRAPHPDMAADIANAVVDAYISRQLKLKKETARTASLWLKKQLDELEGKVNDSAQAVENYRSDNDLISGNEVEITSQQISEVASEIVKSKARIAEASARLSRVQEAMKQENGLSALAEVVESPLIQRLQQEESALLRHKSELATRYGPRHPKMINVNAEIEELRRKIDLETSKIVDNVANEKEIAEAGLRSMQTSLAELKAKKEKQNQASIHLSRLEQDLESNRNMYENTLKRFKEVTQQADTQQADSRVISYAAAPTQATFPNAILMFFLGTMGGILGGLVYVFIREQLDYAIRTPSQLENDFEMPVWGMVPRVDEIKTTSSIASYVINKPYSAAAEAIRSMRVVMAIKRRMGGEGRVVSVTSSVPGEGKTTVAVWLARLIAMSGRKVLLVDCDLRCPKVHECFNRTSVVSLIDVLNGSRDAQDLIEKDKQTGLHMIMGKPMQVSHFDLLTSDKMDQLIASLKKSYDLIVLDTPPTLTMADSRFLSRLADDTLFVVQWGKTHKDAVASSLKMFKAVDLKISGFVLNQVNLKEHARYHYNDSGSYYAKYPEYFAN